MLSFLRTRSMIGLGVLAAVAASVLIATLVGGGERSRARAHAPIPKTVLYERITAPRGTPTATIGRDLPVHSIQSGFVGLSFEFNAVEPYAGTDPNAVNPVLEQLIRNLAPGQQPDLRIGGDSSDWAWWPIPHTPHPRGIRITLTPRWLGVVRTLAHTLNARLIMGLNMEADSSRLVQAEARAFVNGLGRHYIRALELGNEPELYGSFPWYVKDGVRVHGRPSSWDFPTYIQDFGQLAGGLPNLPIAGPAIGSPGWLSETGQFIAGASRLQLLTLHRYPLQRCYMPAASLMFPSIPHLFSPDSSAGLADAMSGLIASAHARGIPVRVDEMNSVSCGGAPGISNTFAAALWSIDAMFQMARVGVDGVNFHTFTKATYALFRFAHHRSVWHGFVAPEYYGLMLFAAAAPPGSKLLAVSGAGPASLKTWATRGRDGHTRVTLVNQSTRPQYVTLRGAGLAGNAQLQRLTAPRLTARGGIRFGGQTFGSSTDTGLLTGVPRIIEVIPVRGGYTVRLPAASAALITFTASHTSA